jgi:hypothetical protein
MKTGGWLIAVFLLTVVSSPWCRSAEQVSDKEKEIEKAIAEVKKLHGEIKYDLSNPDKPIVEGIYFLGNVDDFTDERLEFLKTFTELKYLTLFSTSISDVFMENLSGMKSLEQLNLRANYKITDAGLEQLKGLTKLKKLLVSGNKGITAHGLKHLKELKNLEYLSLAGNENITDDGMENFEAFPKLNTLILNGSRIRGKGLFHLIGLHQLRKLSLVSILTFDDEAVKYLKEMKQLEVLALNYTKLPPHGLEIIGSSLRKCNVLWHEGEGITSGMPNYQHLQFSGREWLQ